MQIEADTAPAWRPGRDFLQKPSMRAVSLLAIAIGVIVQLVGIASEANAQSRRLQAYCQAKYGYCYNFHQCYINYCAGYQVNCNRDWNICSSACYSYYAGYLARQYGPLPKYCR
jgi:hypothetical protein